MEVLAFWALVGLTLALVVFAFESFELAALALVGVAFIGLALEGLTFLDCVFAFTAFAFLAMSASHPVLNVFVRCLPLRFLQPTATEE